MISPALDRYFSALVMFYNLHCFDFYPGAPFGFCDYHPQHSHTPSTSFRNTRRKVSTWHRNLQVRRSLPQGFFFSRAKPLGTGQPQPRSMLREHGKIPEVCKPVICRVRECLCSCQPHPHLTYFKSHHCANANQPSIVIRKGSPVRW